MQTQKVGMVGAAPIVKSGPSERPPEKEIYRRLWEDHPEYRLVSPGEQVAQLFLQQAQPKQGAEVLDLGCGTGRGGLMLAVMGGMRVTMVDFVGASCLDEDVRNALVTQPDYLKFIEADLSALLPVNAEYGFCCDVMEHIRPHRVDMVIDTCLRACQHVFFQISCVDDVCGKLVGHQLHLSVHDYAWWLKKFQDRDCMIHWSQDFGTHCMFYVTAWLFGEKLSQAGELNIEEQAIKHNIGYNIKQPWRQVEPFGTNQLQVAILGGGPSLAENKDLILDLQSKGVGIITLNGAYNWCLDNGITPNATVVVDARPHNSRFVRPVLEGTPDPRINPPGEHGCRYFISSQCDPSVFEGLPESRTFIWHTGNPLGKELLDAQYPLWWTVPGGSTVLTRAISLFRMLGYRRYHLFGCDSCLRTKWYLQLPAGGLWMDEDINARPMEYATEEDAKKALDALYAADRGVSGARPLRMVQHHAYAQPENDSPVIIPVLVKTSSKVFYCHPWMANQASQFIDLLRAYGDELDLIIYGDGLLAHIIEAGAALDDLESQTAQGESGLVPSQGLKDYVAMVQQYQGTEGLTPLQADTYQGGGGEYSGGGASGDFGAPSGGDSGVGDGGSGGE